MKTKRSLLLAAAIASFVVLNTFPGQAQTADPARQLQQLQPVNALPGKAKCWALVIGVDKYAEQQISPLKGADNDARLMSDALVRYEPLESAET